MKISEMGYGRLVAVSPDERYGVRILDIYQLYHFDYDVCFALVDRHTGQERQINVGDRGWSMQVHMHSHTCEWSSDSRYFLWYSLDKPTEQYPAPNISIYIIDVRDMSIMRYRYNEFPNVIEWDNALRAFRIETDRRTDHFSRELTERLQVVAPSPMPAHQPAYPAGPPPTERLEYVAPKYSMPQYSSPKYSSPANGEHDAATVSRAERPTAKNTPANSPKTTTATDAEDDEAVLAVEIQPDFVFKQKDEPEMEAPFHRPPPIKTPPRPSSSGTRPSARPVAVRRSATQGTKGAGTPPAAASPVRVVDVLLWIFVTILIMGGLAAVLIKLLPSCTDLDAGVITIIIIFANLLVMLTSASLGMRLLAKLARGKKR